MEYILKRIMRNASVVTGIIFGIAKKIDYKRLSRYMLRMNQMQDLDSIPKEAAKCLKDILNYRLFAFAVQDEKKLDVWIDPSIYQKPMGKIIEKDFKIRGGYTTHHLNEQSSNQNRMVTFQNTDMMSYVLMDDKYYAKLYMLPDRKMFLYHSEIINIIVKTLGIALNNFMSIKHLEKAAAFDPMTNCYNRREFDRLIEHNIANSKRYFRNLSIIMFDLDRFKKVNDRFGHLAGDAVLKKVSQAIFSNIRKGDYLTRYGGEEFVVVLPDTKRPRAMELAERLRQVIQDLTVKQPEGETIKITASFGVAALNAKSDKNSLLSEADAMLYKAKASGRNRVMPQMKLFSINTVTKTEQPLL